MNQVNRPKQPVCPPGCERLDSQQTLADRMGCSRVEAGRRLAFGRLRPAHAEGSASFYRTSDLDKLRAGAVDAAAAGFARLTTAEQADLVRKFSALDDELKRITALVAAAKAAQDAKK